MVAAKIRQLRGQRGLPWKTVRHALSAPVGRIGPMPQRPSSRPFRAPSSTSRRAGEPRTPHRDAQRRPQQPGWEQLAQDLEKIAEQLAAVAAALPTGEPDAQELKRLLSATGKIGQHNGTLKKALGVGTKKRA